MLRYVYTAISGPQKTVEGFIEADSEQDAINRLAKLGYFPVKVEPENLSIAKTHPFEFKKIANKDIVLFTRQLASLIESGVNILKSLRIISGQTNNKYLKAVINDVLRKIEDGKSLSESLGTHPDFFSSLYTSMVHSGEAGGSLQETLKKLADFLEKEEEFSTSVKSSLIYPLFVFIVGVLTVIVLLVFVIPRLVTMFEDMGQALPLPTRILISLSGALRRYWFLFLAVVFVAFFSSARWKKTAKGKFIWDTIKLKLAIAGEITLKAETSRLMHTLSLLLSSGMEILNSLKISASVLQNEVIKKEMERFKEEIRNGSSFSRCLKSSKLFPSFVTNILTVGEETGSLEKSLARIAIEYEKDVDRKLKALTRLLEPVIILVMGLVVGFIVLSMLLPIFQINLLVR